MKPKKRERTSAGGAGDTNSKANSLTSAPQLHNQTDHDLFLQAFEKPTQIYRFLRCRQMNSPLFLPRTLSYMPGRSTRKANTRTAFRIEDLLSRVEKESNKHGVHRYKSEYLNITFTGFYSEEFKDCKEASVAIYLMKVLHKKRKDSSTSIQPICLGSALVPCDPTSNHSVATSHSPLGSCPSVDITMDPKYIVSIAADKFGSTAGISSLGNGSIAGNFDLRSGSTINGHDIEGENGVKSCVLVIRVTASEKSSVDGGSERGNAVALTSDVSPRRSSSASDCENQQPPRKRLRSSRGSDMAPVYNNAIDGKESYSVQLEVYDKHQRCMLTDGTYVLEMSKEGEENKEVGRGRGRRTRTWETISTVSDKVDTTLPVRDIMFKSTQLRFTLLWSSTPVQNSPAARLGGGLGDLYPPLSACEVIATQDNNLYDIKRVPSMKLLRKNQSQGNSHSDNSSVGLGGAKRTRIFYQFLFNATTRQQTEVTEELRCPWCALLCPRLHALLSHLRASHSRFCFTYIEHPKAGRIDVSINDQYDGSYVGNPQDLRSQLGFAFRRAEPVQRLPVTLMLVSRPKKKRRRKFDLAEFQEPEMEGSKIRHTVQGHNRLYYHTLTSQPVRPCDIEEDSEDELDPEWLRLKTQKMIEEFSDVNEGEKEIMKMWNLHVMKIGYVGDCQMPAACAAFIAEKAPEILRLNLTRNLILHLVNLSDFGLIRPEVVYRTALQFFQLRRHLEERSLEVNFRKDNLSTSTNLMDGREDGLVLGRSGNNEVSNIDNALSGPSTNDRELNTNFDSKLNEVILGKHGNDETLNKDAVSSGVSDISSESKTYISGFDGLKSKAECEGDKNNSSSNSGKSKVGCTGGIIEASSIIPPAAGCKSNTTCNDEKSKAGSGVVGKSTPSSDSSKHKAGCEGGKITHGSGSCEVSKANAIEESVKKNSKTSESLRINCQKDSNQDKKEEKKSPSDSENCQNIGESPVPQNSSDKTEKDRSSTSSRGIQEDSHDSSLDVSGGEKSLTSPLKERCTRSVAGGRNSATPPSKSPTPTTLSSVNADCSEISTARGRRNSAAGRILTSGSTNE